MLPVALDVFRRRFVHGFDRPEPLMPGRPEEFVVNLHQLNHLFEKGHWIMAQVLSSRFPVIDRNLQKYVASIFEARDGDFVKAEETVYFDREHATRVELPVMR